MKVSPPKSVRAVVRSPQIVRKIQGRIDLRIREWQCSNKKCLSLNDRDINAAKNILALGHKRLAVGITSV